MDAGHVGRVGVADGGPEGSVLADQGDGTGPGRQGVEALDEAGPDERASAVSLAARPAKLVNLRNERGNLALLVRKFLPETGGSVFLSSMLHTRPSPQRKETGTV